MLGRAVVNLQAAEANLGAVPYVLGTIGLYEVFPTRTSGKGQASPLRNILGQASRAMQLDGAPPLGTHESDPSLNLILK